MHIHFTLSLRIMPKIPIILLGLFLSLASCSGQRRSAVAGQPEHKEFTLPAIPAELSRPSERADYLLMHYWDNLDFADTLHIRNHDFMEQTFVNFLSIFPVVSPDSLSKGVEVLMSRAESDTLCYAFLADMAEKYLYDPNSPMLNEAHYLPFVACLSRSVLLDEAVRSRYARQHASCLKNRPGTPAADFAYRTPDGALHTLYRTSAPQILLFFYDPDCESCHAQMDELSRHPHIARLIAEKQLRVLAVYADGDRRAWERGRSHIPSAWIDAYECEGKILNEETYVLRAMPTLYLLDADKRVLLKDVQLDTLYEYFNR